MIAKYLFFLILFIVILIHALQPRSRLSAADPCMSQRASMCVCVRVCSVCFYMDKSENIF